MFRAHYGGLFQPPARFSFAALMVLAYRVANSPAEITRLTVIVRIGTAAGNAEPLSGLWKKYGNEEQTMFEYRCSRCGWVVKSPIIFQEKKPCLNCDGFVELQTAEHSVPILKKCPSCGADEGDCFVWCPLCSHGG